MAPLLLWGLPRGAGVTRLRPSNPLWNSWGALGGWGHTAQTLNPPWNSGGALRGWGHMTQTLQSPIEPWEYRWRLGSHGSDPLIPDGTLASFLDFQIQGQLQDIS